MAKIDYNATEADPNAADFDPIPQGTYLAACVASEEKQAKSGQGLYFEFEFEVIEGEHKGRRLWDRINHKHSNDTAQSLGRSKLSQLCHSVNVLQPKDTVELHNIPLGIEVVVKDREDKPGTMTNEIKKYVSKADAKTGSTPAAAAASGGGQKAPWEK